MIPAVKSRRIASGGYVSGEAARVKTILPEPPDPEPDALFAAPDLSALEAEFTARLETARRDSFQAGFAKGLEEGKKAVAPQIETLRSLTLSIESGIDDVWEACRAGSAELAMAIARRIVGEEAERHEELAHRLACRGMELAREQSLVRIWANPADLSTLQTAETALLSLSEGVRRIEFGARASVKPGGVILECDAGSFDLQPEVQLEAVEKALAVEPPSTEASSGEE